MIPAGRAADTLEPVIEAVREGAEAGGWELSGLQKTTSHHFEGRWAGDSTRSAYLFFHRSDGPDWASLDVYLDETSRGLSGDLALVVDACRLGALQGARECLATLAGISAETLPDGYDRPVSARFRLEEPADDPSDADTEVRIKLRIPPAAFATGSRALAALASATASAFGRILKDPRLVALID